MDQLDQEYAIVDDAQVEEAKSQEKKDKTSRKVIDEDSSRQ